MSVVARADTAIKDPKALKIKRALISVSNKNGLPEFAKKLGAFGIQLISTGGTANMLREAGLDVMDISEITDFPEIMDGRVKTLHPKVHGGLLGRGDIDADVMKEHGIESIDLVVVNLYPFSETVAGGADFETCIENIDIGGPAMIRASAKNFAHTVILTDPQDYQKVIDDMEANDGAVTFELRKRLAANAFALTATYDSNVSSWFAARVDREAFPRRVSFSGNWKQTLRYGENSHQSAALYVNGEARPGVSTATQLQGKELSYNNLNDTDAAFECVAEFEEPAVAIIKHANPCGVAVGKNTLEAYKSAFACDPVSAFGGIIALNKTLDGETAQEILQILTEVIIAPSIEPAAMEILAKKKNLRVLTTGGLPDPSAKRRLVKTIAGGLLVQDMDNGHITEEDLKVVTDREPTPEEMEDLLFAFRVCKHVKSNAIIYAANKKTLGIGAGQMSRVDSCFIAAKKMEERTEKSSRKPVVASDAFFPFSDGLITAAEAGVTAVIQPGGSIRDDEVIAAANERGLAMVFTGMRHFRH